MDTNNKWFTEQCEEGGTAFSLELTQKLHEEVTDFQKIEIYATKTFGNLMVIDGFVMLTQRDNFIYHEMLTHPALFTHPEPKNVVIVGGGDCGTLKEVAKHSCVQKITQVEIDKSVTKLSEQYFPELCEANNDPRVELLFEDAIVWMKKAEASTIDLIIVDSTDPIGPAEGLFSTPFYQDCIQSLKADGLLVQQSESPLIHLENIIKPMQNCMLKAGFKDIKLLFFPLPSYPTGWWTATIANKNEVAFAREIECKKQNIPTSYYNYKIHQACFAAPQFLAG